MKMFLTLGQAAILSSFLLVSCGNSGSSGSNDSEQAPLEQPACVNFTEADLPPYEQTQVNGIWMLYSAVPDPKGIFFFFHGGHGQAYDYFSLPECVLFVNQALENGYMVAAMDSAIQTGKTSPGKINTGGTWPDGGRQWSEEPTESNPDLANLQAALQYLKSLSLITPTLPRFALGVSNGGQFTGRLASESLVVAGAILSSRGGWALQNATNPSPVIFVAGQNDTTATLPDVEFAHGNIVANGVLTELHINEPAPMTPGYLGRIAGISCADSEEIYAAWMATGVLDADGYQVLDPKESTNWFDFLPPAYSPEMADIRNVLIELHGGHCFPSNYYPEISRFF